MRKPPAKSKIVGKPIPFATPEDAAAALFDRVASILDEARPSVIRAVNSRMVLTYWLIGREIVQALQGGEERAEYGKAVIDGLSSRLTERYGDGYSATNLKSFRLFYLTYANREPIIRHALRAESLEIETSSLKTSPVRRIRHAAGDELESKFEKSHAARGEFVSPFHSSLAWTHYRAIMRVEKPDAREFYEKESVAAGWSSYVRLYEDLHKVEGDKTVIEKLRGRFSKADKEQLLRDIPLVPAWIGEIFRQVAGQKK